MLEKADDIAVGDANNDSYNDIATANAWHDNISILLWNNITEDWDPELTLPSGMFPYCIEIVGEVTACIFSPDGTRLASAYKEGMIKIWDVATGTEMDTLEGHFDSVKVCIFSPNNLELISASADKALKFWDLTKGTEIRTLQYNFDPRNACAFSPDGTKFLSTLEDMTMRIWDISTGTELHTLRGHFDEIQACTFSPDSSKTISASADRTLKIWDAETGQMILDFPTIGTPECVAISDNGMIVAGDSLGNVYFLCLHEASDLKRRDK
ncbi:MAG: WD40 repeat domain-containing protein [Candidatus Helarchaeota archaeon]